MRGGGRTGGPSLRTTKAAASAANAGDGRDKTKSTAAEADAARKAEGRIATGSTRPRPPCSRGRKACFPAAEFGERAGGENEFALDM